MKYTQVNPFFSELVLRSGAQATFARSQKIFLSRILRTFWNNVTGLNGGRLLSFQTIFHVKKVQSPRRKPLKFLAEIGEGSDPPRWSSLARSTAGGVHLISARSTARAVEPRAHAGDTGRTSTARHRIERDENPGVARSIDSVLTDARTRRSARVTDTRRYKKRRSSVASVENRSSRPLRVLGDVSVRVRSQDVRGRRVER